MSQFSGIILVFLNMKIICKFCQKEFCSNNKRRVFCSQSCSTSFNNKNRNLKAKHKNSNRLCLSCNKQLNTIQQKFCSLKCMQNFRYKVYIGKWLSGEITGTKKEGASDFIRKYLFDKYQNKCARCGWSQKNPYTNKITLEVEHIDGHYDNNSPKNLTLLCPNCHSLTKTYRGANKGNGRGYRYKSVRRLTDKPHLF